MCYNNLHDITWLGRFKCLASSSFYSLAQESGYMYYNINVKKTVTDKIQISIMLMPYFFCESPHIMRTDLAFKTFSLEASDTGLTAVGSWGHFMVMHGLVARISHVRSHGLHWVFLKSREGLINHIERQSFELMKKSVK